MNNCPLDLTTTVGAAAAAISKDLTRTELEFLGALFTQLGATLFTIAYYRDLLAKIAEEKEKEKDC